MHYSNVMVMLGEINERRAQKMADAQIGNKDFARMIEDDQLSHLWQITLWYIARWYRMHGEIDNWERYSRKSIKIW